MTSKDSWLTSKYLNSPDSKNPLSLYHSQPTWPARPTGSSRRSSPRVPPASRGCLPLSLPSLPGRVQAEGGQAVGAVPPRRWADWCGRAARSNSKHLARFMPQRIIVIPS